ncbi:uncharacterized protein [Battus philenor]|uniref:uncharacterized protein n=1 Tax=Battus philenor TaxID=42288 RepID=UPI0035CFA87B
MSAHLKTKPNCQVYVTAVWPPPPTPLRVCPPAVRPPKPAPLCVHQPPKRLPTPAPLLVQPPAVQPPPPDVLVVTLPRICVPGLPVVCFQPNTPCGFRTLGNAVVSLSAPTTCP